MTSVLRWFRILVIALLLPAYGLAAVGAPRAATGDDSLSITADATAPGDDIAALVDELGDTTDDMSDHCLPHTFTFCAAPPPAAPPSLGRQGAVDAPRERILRPPRPAERR